MSLKPWQVQELESLYRQAVRLFVNPAGGPAPCEIGCGRIGVNAHHFIYRSQEPGIRWQYEPHWGLWLCQNCHAEAHTRADEFVERTLERLWVVRRSKAVTLRLYLERHDRLQCPDVSFQWMRAYLKRRIALLQKQWSRAYCVDV